MEKGHLIQVGWQCARTGIRHRTSHGLSKQSIIRAGDLEIAESADEDDLNESGFKTFKAAQEKCVTEFEVNYQEQTLLSGHGSISAAARLANKDRRVFFELLRKHHINANRFKW